VLPHEKKEKEKKKKENLLGGREERGKGKGGADQVAHSFP